MECQEILVEMAKQEGKDILVSLEFLEKAVNQDELETLVLPVEMVRVALKDLSERKGTLDPKDRKVQLDIRDETDNVETTVRLDHLDHLGKWECLVSRVNKV